MERTENKQVKEEQKGIINWLRKHRKELLAAGIGITTLILLIIGIRNREKLFRLWDMLKGIVGRSAGMDIADGASELTDVCDAISNVEDVIPVAEVEPIAISGSAIIIPFEVREHIRNLPKGHRASPEKIAEAAEKGIRLMNGQTLVDTYMKGGVAV